MNFQTDTKEYQHLVDVFVRKQAVAFCGAGVSLEPPAGLPDWNKFRDYTLEAIASKDEIAAAYLPKLTELPMIAIPAQKGLTPELVASEILKNCQGYFECFRSLEEGEPNANHRYLAKLAKSGYLQYILTTNFDLFIEAALKQENLPFKVYSTEKEFADFGKQKPDYSIHILKLHGCISKPKTIIATVEQEARGLSFEKKQSLDWLLKRFCFVFWGYSGADLKIDLDYLRMESMKGESPGFVWNFYESPDYKEPVNPHVKRLKDIYSAKAQIVHGKLPAIFDVLIAPEDQISHEIYTEEQTKKWQNEKNNKLQKSLKDWAYEYIEGINACNIFGRLLQHSGQMDEALCCYKRFAELANDKSEPKNFAIALNNIGLLHQSRGDYDHALENLQEALEIDCTFGNKKCIATSLTNIGAIYKARGEHTQALEEYKKALKLAYDLDDQNIVVGLLNNIGRVYNDCGEKEQALKNYKEALDIARILGDKQVEAKLLINMGEIYDDFGEKEQALENYKEALDIVRILGDKRELGILFNNIGEIYKKRGEHDQALEKYEESLRIARDMGDKKGTAVVAINIGAMYQNRGMYNEALENYIEALSIMEEIRNIPIAAASSQCIAKLYECNGKNEET